MVGTSQKFESSSLHLSRVDRVVRHINQQIMPESASNKHPVFFPKFFRQVAYPAFEGGDEVVQEVEQLTSASVPAGPPADWAGLWRVSYAPHIRTLGALERTASILL